MPVQDFNATIREIEDQSESVRLFTLDLGAEMDFKAGHFVNMSFQEGEERFMKPYSIASSPSIKDAIQFSIKLVPEGRVTPKLWEKKVGDQVSIKGPLGLFTVRNNKEKLVFIGTGTGVAPLRGMIQDELFNKKTEKEITLVFGVRSENEILFHEEFLKYAEEHPNFKYIPLVSRPDKWEGRTGHVQDNFDTIDFLNSEFYICGLPAMFDAVHQKLLEKGAAQDSMFHEVFR